MLYFGKKNLAIALICSVHCPAENSLPLPNFSDIFDLCLHWVSVVRDTCYWTFLPDRLKSLIKYVNIFVSFAKCMNFSKVESGKHKKIWIKKISIVYGVSSAILKICWPHCDPLGSPDIHLNKWFLPCTTFPRL